MVIDESLAKGLMKRERREAHIKKEAALTTMARRALRGGGTDKHNPWLKHTINALCSIYGHDRLVIRTDNAEKPKRLRTTLVFIVPPDEIDACTEFIGVVVISRQRAMKEGVLPVATTTHFMQRLIQAKLNHTLALPISVLVEACVNNTLVGYIHWLLYTEHGVIALRVVQGVERPRVLLVTIIPTGTLDWGNIHAARHAKYIKGSESHYLVPAKQHHI